MRRLLDRALDLAIAPGFSKLGYAARRGGWAPVPRMDGRTVLVTGATSGLGEAAARAFAELGARTLVLARDETRGRRAAEAIGAELVVGDLASLASTRAAARQVAERAPSLDVLVNNAGVMRRTRELSADGHELTFATNVLGTFVLTEALAEPLAAAGGRIVTVSSGGMYGQPLDVDDLQTERRDYDGVAVYARTKRAQVVLTELWAKRLAASGVTAHSMHPGWAATPGVAESLPTFNRVMGPFLRSVEQGADTIVWLGAAPEPAQTTGLFWHDREPRPTHRFPRTREREGDRERLWTSLEDLART